MSDFGKFSLEDWYALYETGCEAHTSRMRTILHSDLNAFYATAGQTLEPSLASVPFAVVGSVEDRHGIVLAKNELAKKYDIKTGEALWQAKKKCPALVTREPNFDLYYRLSHKVREIYARYTDRVESFGIDECWLDVTESQRLFGTGEEIAEKIRAEVKAETGLTVSIGVSYNKVFAKLGSDVKKPDAVTVISKENYQDIVWKMPVENLLYVGRATKQKLNRVNIITIGDLARADRDFLIKILGKWGGVLCSFARGEDHTPVRKVDEKEPIKSIGNSMTVYRDLHTEEDVRAVLFLLSETVAERLCESDVGRAWVVSVSAKSKSLITYGKQLRLPSPTKTSEKIGETAFQLFKESYPFLEPVRALGVAVSQFSGGVEQLTFDVDHATEQKRERFEKAVGHIRDKYGKNSLNRAAIFKEGKLQRVNLKEDSTLHPENHTGKQPKS